MPRRRNGRIVNGVVLLDKPVGMSSNAALQAVRRLYGARKAGHTGTLDPMASGLLPLTFGEATKFSQLLLDADKTYAAEIALGMETDTGDAEGEVVSRGQVAFDAETLAAVLEAFRGRIEQVPPRYSALKRNGKAMYEYARAGIEVELEPRPVTIHELVMLEARQDKLRLRVRCSKGTYVRSLAVDIGRALGCGGHLSALRRTAVGPLYTQNAISLPALESEDARTSSLAPVDTLAGSFPAVVLDEAQRRSLVNGQAVAATGSSGLCRLYGPQNEFLGLGESDLQSRKLRPKRLVASQ